MNTKKTQLMPPLCPNIITPTCSLYALRLIRENLFKDGLDLFTCRFATHCSFCVVFASDCISVRSPCKTLILKVTTCYFNIHTWKLLIPIVLEVQVLDFSSRPCLDNNIEKIYDTDEANYLKIHTYAANIDISIYMSETTSLWSLLE